jgi:hypothetical protein
MRTVLVRSITRCPTLTLAFTGALMGCAHSTPTVIATSPAVENAPRAIAVQPTTSNEHEASDPNDPTSVFGVPRQRVDRTPMPDETRMLSGVWTDAPPADRSAVSFDAGAHEITFRAFAGVGFDRALHPDNDGALRVSATIDPVRNDTASLGWLAFVFTPTRDGAGWPTNAGHTAAVLVRSNGAIQVFSRGQERAAQWEQRQPQPASDYRVALVLRSVHDELVLEGTINEARFTAPLGHGSASLGGRALHLDLCAHYHEAPVESRVSELRGSSGRLW